MTKIHKVKWVQGKRGIVTERQRGTRTKGKKYEGALGQMVARSNAHNSEEAERQGGTMTKGQRGAWTKGYKDTRVRSKITDLLMDSKKFVTFVQLTSNT